jgi:hypothetical protein
MESSVPLLARTAQEMLARVEMMKATEALRSAEIHFSMAARTAVSNRIRLIRHKLDAIK